MERGLALGMITLYPLLRHGVCQMLRSLMQFPDVANTGQDPYITYERDRDCSRGFTGLDDCYLRHNVSRCEQTIWE